MDKYKTSDMGRALKRVFRGQATIKDSVSMATREIAAVFEQSKSGTDDIGFFGDVIAPCPLCGSDIKRFRNFYGCSGYKTNGCKFSVQLNICSRPITVSHVQALITQGKTPVIEGFVSPRTGKTFDAALKLEQGRAVFDFDRSARPTQASGTHASYQTARQQPPPEENPFPPAFYDGQ